MKQNIESAMRPEPAFDIFLGCTAAFSYALISALARVFIENIGNELNPLLALLFSLVVTTLFFHFINLNKLSLIYRKVMLQKKVWVYVMLTTGVLWTTFFIGPYYIGANDYTLLVFATSGLIGAWVHITKNKMNSFLMTFIILLYIGAIYLALIDNALTPKHLIGFILGLLCGISAFLYTKFSSRLQKESGLTTSQTLTIRWWLATIIILISCIPSLHQFASISPLLYLKMLVPTFFGIIIPAYLILTAAVKAGPQISSILQSITPFFTVSLTTLILGNKFSSLEVIASILIMIAVIIFQLTLMKGHLWSFCRRLFINQIEKLAFFNKAS